MARVNFYERLQQTGFHVGTEFQRLTVLFAKEHIGWCEAETLKAYLNRKYFRDSPLRGSYINIDELEAELFDGIHRYGNLLYANVPVDDLYLYCEYLMAMFPAWMMNPSEEDSGYADSQEDKDAIKQIARIIGNIRHILARTNHELLNVGTDKEPKYIIIESNPAAKQAAQVVGDQETAIKLLEYNHFALKGHLPEKKEILLAMGNYLEPLLKSNELQQAGYKRLQSDAGFLLNNFHIRHNNKTGKSAKPFVSAMSDDELETWYDNTYHTLLTVIITLEQVDISASLKSLKDQNGL